MSGEGPESPRWAKGLDVASMRRIRNLVAQEFRARGLSFEFVHDGVEWESDEGAITLDLNALALSCRATDASAWSGLVQKTVENWLHKPVSEQPTLREGDLNQAEIEQIRAEALATSQAAPADSAPVGGLRSPFAHGDVSTSEASEDMHLLSGPIPTGGVPPGPSDTLLVPPPHRDSSSAPGEADEWEESPSVEVPEEEGLGSYGPGTPPRPSGNRWWAYLAIAALVGTFALEIRAYFVDPEAAEYRVDATNEVLLEATPVEEVTVVSELDGRVLGRAPLRFLIPFGHTAQVLLTAPDHAAKRVDLPLKGPLTVNLEPIKEEDPTCTLALAGAGRWKYQAMFGDSADTNGHIEIRKSAIVRVMPEGYGAWLVECEKNGEIIETQLPRRLPPTVEVRAEEPKGALVHLDERPLGSIPQRWKQGRAFANLRLKTVDGTYLSRWIPTPGSVDVFLPTNDDNAPRPTLKGSKLADPTPSYLQGRRR